MLPLTTWVSQFEKLSVIAGVSSAWQHRRVHSTSVREEESLICQAHDERQGDIQSRDVVVVEVSDLPANSCAPNRDRLVSHHMRSHTQTVSSTGFDHDPKVLSVVPLGSHLADHH